MWSGNGSGFGSVSTILQAFPAPPKLDLGIGCIEAEPHVVNKVREDADLVARAAWRGVPECFLELRLSGVGNKRCGGDKVRGLEVDVTAERSVDSSPVHTIKVSENQ